jgi:hypothetical protein
MEINGINGANAYAANSQVTDNTSRLENQNQEAARSDLRQQDVQAARQAFEVNISREAQQLAAENQAPPEPAQAQPAEQTARPDQAAVQQQQAAQVVNIVA